jgi:hypothetical protein
MRASYVAADPNVTRLLSTRIVSVERPKRTTSALKQLVQKVPIRTAAGITFMDALFPRCRRMSRGSSHHEKPPTPTMAR